MGLRVGVTVEIRVSVGAKGLRPCAWLEVS